MPTKKQPGVTSFDQGLRNTNNIEKGTKKTINRNNKLQISFEDLSPAQKKLNPQNKEIAVLPNPAKSASGSANIVDKTNLYTIPKFTCKGNDKLGHPKIYLRLKPNMNNIKCPYCGTTYKTTSL